jgi:methyl-accepting chemotaxis protein
MLTSLFSRVFAAISMSMMLLIVAYSLYTASAFDKLSNQTASELEQLTINSLEKQLSRQVADSARIVDTSYEGLLLNVNLTFKILSFLLPDADIAISSQKTETASKSLPTLLLGGKVLNGDFTQVDEFARMTGNIATVFVKDGDDFVRITTSLKKEDGTRAYGTNLDKEHPAYQKLKQNEAYTGLATLFGKQYMTHYAPIVRNGQTIGVLFIGYDASKELENMVKQLKLVKIGKTGYLFALNKAGTLVLHPTREGKNIFEKKDVNGFAYIKEQIQLAKEGTVTLIRYTIPDKEGDVPREKLAAYIQLPSLGWILSSSAYPEEFTKEFTQAKETLVNELSNIQLTALLLLILSGIVIVALNFVVLKKSLLPLTRLSIVMQQIVLSGDLSQRAPTNAVQEVSLVAIQFNDLITQMEAIICDADKVLFAMSQGDFNAQIARPYPGSLGNLAQTVTLVLKQVTNTVAEINRVMEALVAGQFKVVVNDAAAQGEFKRILVQAKDASGYLSQTITDINHVMTQMNEGDFNARVQVQAHGDLQTMKENVNNSMDRLAMAVSGITYIVSAQAKGDLTKECTAEFKGQLKELQTAINASSRGLKAIVSQAVSASTVVNDAVGQVSQGSADLSVRVQQQASALEQTSAAMTQMAAAVQANAASARQAASLTSNVDLQAKEGVQVMQQTISAMQSIRESSHKINDIVAIIDSIAFQTNLLALNAAVEAARAGEHGRGFAVVASEVRALAGKSADAAKDIKHLINDSVTRIENGTHLADKSGEVLGEISTAIVQVAAMVAQIASASHEQGIGIKQVNHAISDIDRMTQENAALVEETTCAAESLGNEAHNLHQNMSFFKTS